MKQQKITKQTWRRLSPFHSINLTLSHLNKKQPTKTNKTTKSKTTTKATNNKQQRKTDNKQRHNKQITKQAPQWKHNSKTIPKNKIDAHIFPSVASASLVPINKNTITKQTKVHTKATQKYN